MATKTINIKDARLVGRVNRLIRRERSRLTTTGMAATLIQEQLDAREGRGKAAR